MRGISARHGLISALIRTAFLSAALWAALFSFAFAESISDFRVDIMVEDDGRMVVTEEITYLFTSSRHGIYRTISDNHTAPPSAWYLNRRIEPRLVSVTRNGSPEPYTVDSSYDGLSVKIGDPNVTIQSEHVYRITYIVDGAINQTPEGPEIYWNATGDEWQVQMRNIEVVVRAARGASLGEEQACYAGPSGSTERCDEASLIENSNGVIARFAESTLAPGQQLTVAQRVNLSTEARIIEEANWVLVLALCIFFWFVFLGVFLWRWERHHRTGQTIIAQYEPFRDFKPMFTGVLMDGRLDAKDITAGIIRLAQEGFISIKQTTEKVLFVFESNDYEITLLRPISEAPSHFQTSLLHLLFEGGSTMYNIDLFKKILSQPKEVRSQLSDAEAPTGLVVKLSEIKKDQSRLRENAKILRSLRKAVEKDLVEEGFVEQTMSRTYKAGAIAVMMFVLIATIQFISAMSITIVLIMLFIGLNGLVLIGVMAERRTALGYQALDHLKGFKQFLSVTDKERFKFHNAPSKSPQQFMQYLPYAIAFGVEEEWAKVFDDIQLDSPDWYSSDVPNASFSAISFGRELSGFSQSFVSSTGSSGSSGGGSSGGGSGGGGGGSW